MGFPSWFPWGSGKHFMKLKERIVGWWLEGAVKKDGLRRKIALWIVERKVNHMKLSGSWQTSLAGVGVILGAIGTALAALTDNDPLTVVNFGVTITAIITGVGLIMARDNNKSSEQVGAGVIPPK